MNKSSLWTPTQIDTLRRLRERLTIKEIVQELGVSYNQVTYRLKLYGIKVGPLCRKDLYYSWTPDKVEILKTLYSDTLNSDIALQLEASEHAVFLKAMRLGLKKSPEYLKTKVRYWRQTPQGREFSKAQMILRNRDTGTEVASKNGYVRVKVSRSGSRASRWRLVHHLVWESANGPIPAGYVISFKDGDKKNIAIDNLQMLKRLTCWLLTVPTDTPKRSGICWHCAGR